MKGDKMLVKEKKENIDSPSFIYPRTNSPDSPLTQH